MSQKAFKYTERDYSILCSLFEYKYLSVSQVEKLHFPSLQTAYRRMKILKDQGQVESLSIPEINEAIYYLTKQGYDVVKNTVESKNILSNWTEIKSKPHSNLFMGHFLAISNFRINLFQACKKSDIRLVGFIPEYFSKGTGKGVPTKYIRDTVCVSESSHEMIPHTPDGVFVLEKHNKLALFFLEIDMGTEVVSKPDKGVLKFIQYYVNYLLQGKYQRYCSDFDVDKFKGFRSLTVTTSERRIANIRLASESLSESQKAKRFQWITTFSAIEDKSVFEPIWVSIDPTDSQMYQIG